MNIDTLKSELRAEEGFKPYAYSDKLGFWTIGIGRLCDRRKSGSGLTEEEALYLLGNDIKKTYTELSKRIPWFMNMSDARQRAIMNMAFQLGTDGLMTFTNTLNELKMGHYAAAADSAMKSKWATQTPERAARICKQIREG